MSPNRPLKAWLLNALNVGQTGRGCSGWRFGGAYPTKPMNAELKKLNKRPPALRMLLASAGAFVLALVLAPTFCAAATWTVTSTGDSGAGTLRTLIAGASSGDTINFAAALSGQTITLTSGEL